MIMFCPKCGAEAGGEVNYCSRCGASLGNTMEKENSVEEIAVSGQKATPNITLCTDGKYRWVYELSLFKNSTIFILIWKIFFFIFFGIFVFMFIVNLFEGNVDGEMLINMLKFSLYFLIGMTVIVGISYLIYAAVMGGKYIVVFEMDDKGIKHIQHPKQAKKAEVIADIAILAGAATGKLSTMAAGMNARTEMETEFSAVRKVKSYPRRNLIKVNCFPEHNQVYAEKEDFDFVRKYIIEHCTNAKIRK